MCHGDAAHVVAEYRAGAIARDEAVACLLLLGFTIEQARERLDEEDAQ